MAEELRPIEPAGQETKENQNVPREGATKSSDHEGATEEQVAETPAPSGGEFQDEPRQG
jgi:hypothetical protein